MHFSIVDSWRGAWEMIPDSRAQWVVFGILMSQVPGSSEKTCCTRCKEGRWDAHIAGVLSDIHVLLGSLPKSEGYDIIGSILNPLSCARAPQRSCRGVDTGDISVTRTRKEYSRFSALLHFSRWCQ